MNMPDHQVRRMLEVRKFIHNARIRTLLTVPIILQMLAVTGFIGWLSFRNAENSVRQVALELRREVTNRIQDRVRTLMEVAPLVNRLNADSLREGLLRTDDPANRERHFSRMISTFPQISYTFVGTPDGRFYGARRLGDGQLQLVKEDPSTEGNSRYYDISDDGTSGVFRELFNNFDPRTRPWYKAALRDGKPTWSGIYRHFAIPGLAVTAAHPVYDRQNRLIGVMGVDFILTRISDFLRQLKAGRSGTTFIMERSGAIVAASSTGPLYTLSGATVKRFQAAEVPNPVISATARFIASRHPDLHKITGIEQMEFYLSDDLRYVQVTPFSDQMGLNWLIVVVVPKSDYDQLMRKNSLITLLLITGSLILVTIGSWYMTNRVVGPIVRLNESAKALAGGKWDETLDTGRNDELGELATSFRLMARQLSGVFSGLENTIHERTAELTLKNEQLNREIADRISAEEQLVAAKREAEEANHAKSRFLALMSHEIRTPMNGVLGTTDLLLNSPLNEEQRECVQNILLSGNALLDIINQILDFSKIEAGQVTLDLAPFDLRRQCAMLIDLLAPRAAEKGLSLSLDYPASFPNSFVGDVGKIRQIIMNLVGNALKFTETGGVTVAVAAASRSDATAEITIAVRDTGIGIDKEKIGSLFEMFSQIDDPDHRKAGGTGLGLAISRQLAELMGGTIRLESRRGAGTIVTMTLPLRTAAEEVRESDAPPPQPPPALLSSMRVLVADDNLINRKVATKMLEQKGCIVDLAEDGRQALEMSAAVDYDLILMDCSMPEMSGFEATAAIRERERLSGAATRVAIVALTANARQEDREACMAAGMDDFLAKPFKRSEIEELLIRFHTQPC